MVAPRKSSAPACSRPMKKRSSSEDDELPDPDYEHEEELEDADPAEVIVPSTPVRQGRNGPRSHSSASGHPSPSRTSPSKASPETRRRDDGTSSSTSQAQKRPRGNLPSAPSFDGDRKKDPRCFKKYANKVDSYVAIAKRIIDSGEIGLRLHAALEGEAADFLEDVPAKVFGAEDGWQVLIKILRDKYDEPTINKVGTAMRNFFQLQIATDKTLNMRDIAEYMDRAARQCRDAGLQIPDAVMIHFFFIHSGASTERQANLLLRTQGEYDWKKLKTAIDILYPNVVVRNTGGAGKGDSHRGRGAHEVHHSDQWTDWVTFTTLR